MLVTIMFCLRLGTSRRRFESAQAFQDVGGHKGEMTRHFQRVTSLCSIVGRLFIYLSHVSTPVYVRVSIDETATTEWAEKGDQGQMGREGDPFVTLHCLLSDAGSNHT